MNDGPPRYCLKKSKKQKISEKNTWKNKKPRSVLRLHLNYGIKTPVAIYRYDLITLNYF